MLDVVRVRLRIGVVGFSVEEVEHRQHHEPELLERPANEVLPLQLVVEHLYVFDFVSLPLDGEVVLSFEDLLWCQFPRSEFD